MDPQTAWNELLAAYGNRDPDRIEEHARALQDWLLNGGFPPDTGGGRAVGDEWHRHLTFAAIALALEYVAASRDDMEQTE